jgi:hypothetical protein
VLISDHLDASGGEKLWYLSKLPSDKQVSTRCALGIPVYQLNAGYSSNFFKIQ